MIHQLIKIRTKYIIGWNYRQIYFAIIHHWFFRYTHWCWNQSKYFNINIINSNKKWLHSFTKHWTYRYNKRNSINQRKVPVSEIFLDATLKPPTFLHKYVALRGYLRNKILSASLALMGINYKTTEFKVKCFGNMYKLYKEAGIKGSQL